MAWIKKIVCVRIYVPPPHCIYEMFSKFLIDDCFKQHSRHISSRYILNVKEPHVAHKHRFSHPWSIIIICKSIILIIKALIIYFTVQNTYCIPCYILLRELLERQQIDHESQVRFARWSIFKKVHSRWTEAEAPLGTPWKSYHWQISSLLIETG